MLAILSTHPIQYQVPLWQALAKDGRVPFEVWYLSDHATRESFDSEFKQSFAWDLDMLSGYPSRFLKTNKNADVARFSRLRLAGPLGYLLRERKVKALWIQGWQVAAYWQAVWQAHAIGIPVWVRGESNDLAPVATWKRPIKQVALRRLFSKISDFLYIGEANRRFYQNFGIRDEQLHPAYYCVDNERFKNQAAQLRPNRAAIRQSWGIPEDAFCMLFAGKFIPKKRPMDLVKAATDLMQTSGKKIHLLFAGSGELSVELRHSCDVTFDADWNSGLEAMTTANGNPPHASFTGFLNQTEISKAYVAADCLVLPSDYRETWGLVVNEALASGLRCVVSDACGCAEDLITPELCFPVGDTDALALALGTVMSNSRQSSNLERRAQKFDVAVSIATVQKLFTTLNGIG